jgi:hypothetical protein
MTKKLIVLPQKEIENRIFTIRSMQVMIDKDLAEMYGVETRVLNQAVKRNIYRFPEKFRFQLIVSEKIELVTNCDRLKSLKHSSVRPYAFTEAGVAMLSAVLNSKIAVNVSVQIMNAFVEMRKLLLSQSGLFQRIDKIEMKQIEVDQKFEQNFKALENKKHPPEKGIFFEGQLFDAYTFVADMIKRAEKSIVIIDNYVDESVLTLLTKRKEVVTATIYTKQISKQLLLDLKKHNAQYPAIEIKIFENSHDRFVLIDEKNLYHVGASLKDLGKKWFAFSKMDSLAEVVLRKLMSRTD